MKVLILSCSTGGGHNAAAKALMEEFQRRGVQADLDDALRFGGPRTSRVVSSCYINMASRTPWLFGGLYRAGDLIRSDRRKSPVYLANTLYAETLHRFVCAGGYDAVVYPHLFPAEAFTCIRRKFNPQYRCYAVSTDYTCIPFWEETEQDALFIPHADLMEEYSRRGIPSERLVPAGIPVSSRFSEHIDPVEARRRLQLEPASHVVLLMTGSMGFGDILPLPQQLCAMDAAMQVVVLTGSNQALKNRLEEQFSGSGRVRAVSFTNRVPEYMAAADVLLTKPGGLSSTEAAVFGIPMIHTDPIPGCETRNAAFFQERGMSLRACGREEIVQTAASLVANPLLQQSMRAAQQRCINPNAARDIVQYILDR